VKIQIGVFVCCEST